MTASRRTHIKEKICRRTGLLLLKGEPALLHQLLEQGEQALDARSLAYRRQYSGKAYFLQKNDYRLWYVFQVNGTLIAEVVSFLDCVWIVWRTVSEVRP